MGLFNFFKKKRQSASEKKRQLAFERDYQHNEACFDRFYHDLENDALPVIPEPTRTEILICIQERKERASRKGPLDDAADEEKVLENLSIPVEVSIWVEKVYKHYFENLIPMRGLFRWCEGAQKELYRYKGYHWNNSEECYPTVIFD